MNRIDVRTGIFLVTIAVGCVLSYYTWSHTHINLGWSDFWSVLAAAIAGMVGFALLSSRIGRLQDARVVSANDAIRPIIEELKAESWPKRLGSPDSAVRRRDLFDRARKLGGKLYIDVSFDGMNLCSEQLEGFRFVHCSFSSTNLSKAKLDGALFHFCEFDEADLSGASLRSTVFWSAQRGFENAKLMNVDLDNSIAVYAGDGDNPEKWTRLDWFATLQRDRAVGVDDLKSRYSLKYGHWEGIDATGYRVEPREGRQ